ncbi:bacillithiol system redox-active protein YtxJ [Seonamhaeicola sp. MEBiC1930]|uniref:bacillithiol system redox-active protein YtxJ n=1 Tax=Seonamhaeicola sp. MEBiC01930 TaxID=2976768 RepID=UPI003250605C
MGLINKIFGTTTEKREAKVLPWIPLENSNQINEIKEKSLNKTQLIFKHSTRCGISGMVMNHFVNAYHLNEDDVDLYFLDLLNYRSVSDEVGYKFQVIHESPQLLVIKNGVTLAHASHGAINELDLTEFI